MQPCIQRHITTWMWVVGAIGTFVTGALSGCSGTEMGGTSGRDGSSASGGSNGSGGNSSGGSNGTGGSSSGGSNGNGGSVSGGASGTGGISANCTGGNDGATIIRTQCAVGNCHDTADANVFGAGLDLTINSGIANRLVDVVSPGDTAAYSVCGGNTEPYLKGGSSPATGLLIQKIQSNPECSASESPPCCGSPMPLAALFLLSTQQQNCIIQWATTLTSP